MTKQAPRIGIISLGCPMALVDSERILTQLGTEGYVIADRYDDADVVLVNTCGFTDTARAESLDAIQEAAAENGRVIVTGCLGHDTAAIRSAAPDVLSITGPHQYDNVVAAVRDAVPPAHAPDMGLMSPEGLKFTPRHYSYLKISEGCSNPCAFCIVPNLRGPLVNRPINEVLAEAERLVDSGARELLVTSHDTGAYGELLTLVDELSALNIWVRLHNVYPHPHIDDIVQLMADGKTLPFLDIPFQHASPTILKAMRHPTQAENALDRIGRWREVCPDIAIQSTFMVGFPGETEQDFDTLLNFLEDAQLDRVTCMTFENVHGAQTNAFADHVDEDDKLSRQERFEELAQNISERKLMDRLNQTMLVLIDDVSETGATGRTYADSPDVGGQVFIEDATGIQPGDFVRTTITKSSAYDLWGHIKDETE